MPRHSALDELIFITQKHHPEVDLGFLAGRIYADALTKQEQRDCLHLITVARTQYLQNAFFEPTYHHLLHLYVLNGSRLHLLKMIDRRLRGLAEGHGSLLTISGVSDIGKTSLVLAFQERSYSNTRLDYNQILLSIGFSTRSGPMKSTMAVEEKTPLMGARILAFVGRLLLAIAIPLIAFFVLYLGFLFLRDSEAPQWLITIIAIVWGVGGVAVLYWVFNNLVETFPEVWRRRLLPFVFVGPAMAILAWYLAIPTLRTFWISLFDRNGPPRGMNMLDALQSNDFVGLSNYAAVFSDKLMLEAFRNNIMWIIFGSTFAVVFGLLIATLADRGGIEKVAKSFIFRNRRSASAPRRSQPSETG